MIATFDSSPSPKTRMKTGYSAKVGVFRMNCMAGSSTRSITSDQAIRKPSGRATRTDTANPRAARSRLAPMSGQICPVMSSSNSL
ncbi:hypothetical protein D3C71_1608850 [compost metagenome]